MKFSICRTSGTLSNEAPLSGRCVTPVGKNHAHYTVWTIELDSLEDLLKLAEEVGESLIIHETTSYWDEDLPSIEIYDY